MCIRDSSIPNKAWVIIICPVDETGRNSVNPSTIAITIASILFIPAVKAIKKDKVYFFSSSFVLELEG